MSRVRVHQLRLLVRPTAHATPWLGPVAGATLALAVQRVAGEYAPAPALQFATIALALGVAFALDDPAARSLAASPASLAFRNGFRAVCALSLPALVWLVLLLRSGAPWRTALTVELVGQLATVLAIAAVGVRVGESGGSVAAPALLGLIGAAQLLPARTSLLVAGAPPSTAFLLGWAAVLGLAAATWVAANVDPASPRQVSSWLARAQTATSTTARSPSNSR